MARSRKAREKVLKGIAKCPTGIRGLDEITGGGLPRGRPTLVSGGAGSGKTLLAMEFVIRGARDFGEPGVVMPFEETARELSANVASLGFDVDKLCRDKMLAIDHVRVERSEIQETGDYDLEGLFVRLGSLIDEIGAKRVAIDTIEVLFAGLPNEAIIRSELRRLFGFLKAKRVTAVITGELGEGTLTRYGLEEYVSDCVIFLDHRLRNQVATRRLRVVKYRGSSHGTNEYPTLIDEHGLSVLPISTIGLTYPVTTKRISSGLPQLDEMLGGKGFYRGTSVLVSGTAGSGKSSVAALFAQQACRNGENALYFSFEESADQIMRNMSSIGINLQQWVDKGLLTFHNIRPTVYGLEAHLVSLHRIIEDFEPSAVVIDPVSNLTTVGDPEDIKSMLTRLVDFMKNRDVTSMFTSLTEGGPPLEQTAVGISSIMDTWLLLRMVESSSERNRMLYVLKSRGMAHSNQMREFHMSSKGIELVDVYVGPGEVLTGSARLAQEARDRAAVEAEAADVARRQRELDQQRQALEAEMLVLQDRMASVQEELAASRRRQQDRRQGVEAAKQAQLGARTSSTGDKRTKR